MLLQKIRFLPRVQAERLVPASRVAALTFHDPDAKPHALQPGFAAHASFAFHDIDAERPGQVLMSLEQARGILTFVEGGVAHWDELVVSCELGQSRSAAAALFFSELVRVPCLAGSLPVDALRYAIYNRLVYRRLHEAAHGAVGSAFAAP